MLLFVSTIVLIH